MQSPTNGAVKGHFPKKGERFIDGVWVLPGAESESVPVPAAVSVGKPAETAADRRNWLRKRAGWPVRT